MTRAEELRSEIISYLLTLYPVKSGAQYLRDVVVDYLSKDFNVDFTDKFWAEQGERLRTELIEETNGRIASSASLRYEILDDIGERVRGAGARGTKDQRTSFQDALQDLTPFEFERLAGVLLQWAGCHSAWLTPGSHDQGLDAFGFSTFLAIDDKWPCGRPELILLAQAKHYRKNRVSSHDLREFIGSVECAKHKIFAVQGEKYAELQMRPFAPVALIFLTSGELKVTAKMLARRCGMIVVASDELHQVCEHYWKEQGLTVPRNKHGYLACLKKQGLGLPVAR